MKSHLFIHIISVCIAFANFALAGIVLTARRYQPAHGWMALTAITAGLWGIGVTVFLLTPPGAQQFAEMIVRAYYVVAAVIPLCLLGLAVCFPKIKHWHPGTYFFLLLGYVVVATLLVTPGGVISGVVLDAQAGNSILLHQPYYLLFVVYFVAYAALASTLFINSYREARRARQTQVQKQLRTLLGGMIIALVLGSFFSLIMPLIGNRNVIWVGPLCAIIYIAPLFYAILRQGLFDLRAALASTTAYSTLLISLVAFYAFLIYTVTDLFFAGQQINERFTAVYVAIGLVVTLTYSPLKKLIDRVTHRLFYRNEYHTADVTRRLSDIMAEEIELEALVRRSLDLLDQTLGPEYIAAYVADSTGKLHHFTTGEQQVSPHQRKVQLDIVATLLGNMPRIIDAYEINTMNDAQSQHLIKSSHASMILQFVVQHERVGALFIGNKRSGQMYNEKDLHLLATASDELALAIQNSLRFGEIQHFNDTLKEKVAGATEKLRRTNRELQRLDEAKDEFVSVASHQLRTPLTSIKGYISMVMEGDAGKINDQQKKLLSEAYSSSERMVHLISDFLSVSRLQTGKFIIDTQPIDLDDLIRHEVETMQAIAASHTQKLEYIRPVSRYKIMVDEAKLQQVVMNFIDNAVYYSRPNTTIKVTLQYIKGEAIFTVKDTGIGVPESEQEKLFSKFFRASNARKQRPDGTGVGLYLAKRVVTAHEGQIIFSSKEGRGSTFGFRLPLTSQLDESLQK